MLKKICRCGKVIPYSIKICDQCKTKADIERKQNIKHYKKTTYERDSKYNKFYKSREWEVLRQVAIVRDKGLCQDCLNNNKIVPFYTVHHIIPIKVDWSKRLNTDNLICLCESCHQIRHKLSNNGRGY